LWSEFVLVSEEVDISLIEVEMIVWHTLVCKDVLGISCFGIKFCRVARQLLAQDIECFMLPEPREVILSYGREELTEGIISNKDYPSAIFRKINNQFRLTSRFGI
jgi:hypothetical protein